MTHPATISVINPNTTSTVTDLLLASARKVAGCDTVLHGVTAPRGVPYISNPVEALIGGVIALEMMADERQDPVADAFILAAFGDPGLLAARQLFDLPVVGMSEAAMLTACMLGKRFAIVTFARSLADWYQECVEMHGLRGRLSGIHSSDTPFTDLSTVQSEAEECLVRLSLEAVSTGADVIILGGAPLAGLAERVGSRIPVPTVDPISAAVKQAEAIIALKPRIPMAGSLRRPDAKATTGLHPTLAGRLEHMDLCKSPTNDGN